MNNQKSIFIGALNLTNKPDCGETIKNSLLLERLNEHYSQLEVIDTKFWKKNPLILLKILHVLLSNKFDNIILSTSSFSAYKFIIFYNIFRTSSHLHYFVIGGILDKMIVSGKFKKKYFLKVKNVFVEGQKMCATLREIELHNVFYLPNFKKIKPLEIGIKNDNNEKTSFFFLSRIVESKGIDLIHEVVKSLNKTHITKFSIDFYGEIDEKFHEKFSSMIKQYDNLAYKGFIDINDSINRMQLSTYDAMLFPTYWSGEGFPGVLIDSLSLGVPVISSDWNFNGEVITNKVGYLFPSKNHLELKKIMINCIENPSLLTSKKESCHEYALSFDVTSVISKKFLKEFL